MTTADFTPGNYRFLPFAFQYSSGVAAMPGYEIERVQFRKPVPLMEGFERVEHVILELCRPLTSFCACELRSPLPFSDDGFRTFNQLYVETLAKWGIYDGTTNPVARSNVCPELTPPPEPSLHAFCFTVPAQRPTPTFVVSGSGEAREGGQALAGRATTRPELDVDDHALGLGLLDCLRVECAGGECTAVHADRPLSLA